MKFIELASEYSRLYSSIQDVQQAMYGIQKFTNDDGTLYHFICFFNTSRYCMDTTIADAGLAEIKLIGDLPINVKAAFGAFNNALIAWVEERGEFPAHVPTQQQLHDLLHRRNTGQPPTITTRSIEDDYRIK